ncbi:MAG: flagellar hook-associated protein FlgL [Oligoflexales bacterium]|nr:flagellar hook-associated protein FlgL [Oligoflexales bacterium]
MRISERQKYDIAAKRVENAKENNSKMMELLSTQKRINRLSDDPVGLGQVVKHKNRIANYQQYSRNIKFSKGFLERMEHSVEGMHEYLMRAKELTVAMCNSTYAADSRKSVAKEIKEIIDAVVSLANTTYGSKYLFSGFRTGTPPLSNQGQYMGDDGCIYVQIDEGHFRQINTQSRKLFEPDDVERQQGHFGMIQTLEIIYEGCISDDKDMLRVGMDELDFQMEKTSSYQATLGAIQNAIENTEKRVELSEELGVQTASLIEDVDAYRASSDFKRTETVLQSSLMSSNKLLQPSLLNFLQ